MLGLYYFNFVDFRGCEQLKVLKQVSFQVPTDLKSLDQVLFYFDQLKQPWIKKKDWLQCQLALVEGFTNAVRHAHRGIEQEGLFIEIELTISEQAMEIRIWDYGEPFDLQTFIDKIKRRSQPDHTSGGGRGIEILYKVADHLNYIRTDDHRNCLLIIKSFNR